MTFDEFMIETLKIFPHAQIEQDNDGQLLVYTGLTVESDDGYAGEWPVIVMPEETETDNG